MMPLDQHDQATTPRSPISIQVNNKPDNISVYAEPFDSAGNTRPCGEEQVSNQQTASPVGVSVLRTSRCSVTLKVC